MKEYVASWSGGKDSCMAYWKAVSIGLKVSYLLNFVHTGSTRVMSHGFNPHLVTLQAQAMEMPLVQQEVTWETYERGFKKALTELKAKGVTGLVTGDIYLQEHRDWIERVSSEVGLEAVLPLWEMDTTRLFNDFINEGFKAFIVSVKTELLGREWLGREMDSTLLADLQKLAEKKPIDPCGEGGEFHTFVYDGPAFKRPVKILNSTPVERDDRWILKLTEYRLG